MPTGLPLMGMFRVGQQVLCWSCCKVLMKALDGSPNLPWGSAHLPGRKPWESSQETQHILITGASWKGWITSHMQSTSLRFPFLPVDRCQLLSSPLPPTHTQFRCYHVRNKRRASAENSRNWRHTHLSHVSSFSSPCFLFTSIASLFCSMTFYSMFVPKVEASWSPFGNEANAFKIRKMLSCQFSSVQFSRSVVCDSLRPHESQHARPPCPSPTPGVHSDSRPSSPWCHPAISSSVVPFSSCPQSLPASESFPVSQLFTWGGQSTGVSALASFLPKNTQDWSPCSPRDSQESSPTPQFKSINSLALSFLHSPTLTSIRDHRKNHSLN